ncbi:MAG TPA: hypothetical protein VHB25_13050 [Gemmatimonadaceae bacterium]|nr:hypothetical protein [Gemmatimonadaceae bacterium]
MFADTLFRAEQMHLLRMMIWAGLSVLSGTAIATLLTMRRIRSPLLAHFALQMAAWGVAIAGVTAIEWRGLAMRDLTAATRLDRLLWMNVGLDIGYIAVGATLALAAWLIAKRVAAVGAGVGIIVQGLALLVLHLQFTAAISR